MVKGQGSIRGVGFALWFKFRFLLLRVMLSVFEMRFAFKDLH